MNDRQIAAGLGVVLMLFIAYEWGYLLTFTINARLNQIIYGNWPTIIVASLGLIVSLVVIIRLLRIARKGD